MIINRVWAMPNDNTFTVNPIHELRDARHYTGPESNCGASAVSALGQDVVW